jgi:hypothetical protein
LDGVAAAGALDDGLPHDLTVPRLRKYVSRLVRLVGVSATADAPSQHITPADLALTLERVATLAGARSSLKVSHGRFRSNLALLLGVDAEVKDEVMLQHVRKLRTTEDEALRLLQTLFGVQAKKDLVPAINALYVTSQNWLEAAKQMERALQLDPGASPDEIALAVVEAVSLA